MSGLCNITDFSIPGKTISIQVNTYTHVIDVLVDANTDLRNVIPSIQVDKKASVSPSSGQIIDLSQPKNMKSRQKMGVRKNGQ